MPSPQNSSTKNPSKSAKPAKKPKEKVEKPQKTVKIQKVEKVEDKDVKKTVTKKIMIDYRAQIKNFPLTPWAKQMVTKFMGEGYTPKTIFRTMRKIYNRSTTSELKQKTFLDEPLPAKFKKILAQI